MQDPYAVLGVPQDASDADIKAAFRRLVKRFHPDHHPDDQRAADRFRAITAAHALLNDPEKRRQFNHGEIDAGGRPIAPDPRQGRARESASESAAPEIAEVATWTRGAFRGFLDRLFEPRPSRLELTAEEADRGAATAVRLRDGRHIRFRVPPGLRDGQRLRLRPARHTGGPDRRGDSIVLIAKIVDGPRRRPARRTKKKAEAVQNAPIPLAISLADAVFGAKIRAKTPVGTFNVVVPPASDTGRILRLKRPVPEGRRGTGRDGELLLRVEVHLGDPDDDELRLFAAEWRGGAKGRATSAAE